MPHVSLYGKLKRCYSLKKHKDFRYTYRVGKSVSCREFALVFAKNRARLPQVGFSVSKKIGNAVVRNRVKRRMREALMPCLPLLRPGINVIFIARDAAVDADFTALQRNIRALLLRAGLLTEASA